MFKKRKKEKKVIIMNKYFEIKSFDDLLDVFENTDGYYLGDFTCFQIADYLKNMKQQIEEKDKQIERLNNIINDLKQKNNLAENILYDYLYNNDKITKEKYEQFKELKGECL